jgi:hypothetical protein
LTRFKSVSVFGHERAQYAFADAAIGDAERLGRPDIHDRVQDRATGDDEVGAFEADAGQSGALFQRHARHHLADRPHRLARHHQPVHGFPVVARQREMHAGERRHRAACAHQPDILLRFGQELGKATKSVADALAHAAEGGDTLGLVLELAAFAFRQRDDAPGRAPPALDPRHLVAVRVDQHKLGRAAANVEDERRPVARLEQPMAAEHGQPRLLLGAMMSSAIPVSR